MIIIYCIQALEPVREMDFRGGKISMDLAAHKQASNFIFNLTVVILGIYDIFVLHYHSSSSTIFQTTAFTSFVTVSISGHSISATRLTSLLIFK